MLYKTILALFLRAGGALGALLFSIVAYRLLNADDAGRFFFSMNGVIFLSLLSRLGIDNALVKMSAIGGAGQEVSKNYLYLSLTIVILFSTAIACAVYFLSGFLSCALIGDCEYQGIISVMSLAVVGHAIISVFAFYNQGVGRYYNSVIYLNILVYVFPAIAMLIWNVTDVQVVSIIYVASVFLNAILIFIFTGAYPISPSWDKNFIFVGLNLWVVAVASQFMLWGGQFVGGAILSAEDVAVINASQRLSMVTSFILMAINLIFGSKFSKAHALGEKSELLDLVALSFRISILFSIPAFFVLFCFSSFFMSLFGEYYSSYYVVFRVFLLGQLVNVITGPCLMFLSVTGNEVLMRRIVFFVFGMSCFLYYYFIVFLGVLGAGLASFSVLTVQNLLLFFLVIRHLDVTFSDFCKKVVCFNFSKG